MRLLKIVGLAVVLLVAAGCALAAALLSFWPPFGGSVQGDRAARAFASPQFRGGHFENVIPKTPMSNAVMWDLLKRQFSGTEMRTPPQGCPPVVRLATADFKERAAPGLRAIWFGHASVYLEIDGVRVMTDPVLSDYASPFAGIGPKRFHPPPLPLEELPKIYVVVISHDHYEHLDVLTVRRVAQSGTRFIVPLGIGAHLERWGVPGAQFTELDWWEAADFAGVKFTSAPARHYSSRALRDGNATLWSSWSIAGPAHKVYFSGDTGFGPHFQEIGERLGPFDLSLIKIGAYGPGPGWLDIHMDPEQAVKAHMAVKAARMLPVHWATFNLAFHAWNEPIQRTLAAARGQGIEVVTPRIGETVDPGAAFKSEPWWETCSRGAAG
jgi:L-ascorbate metabolism protein UlaG (beta-lactamase superfamily)